MSTNNPIDEIISAIDGLVVEIRGIRTLQVSSTSVRNDAKQAVLRYFTDWKPKLVACEIAEDELKEIDSSFQELLELTHRKSLKSKYLSCLKILKKRSQNSLLSIRVATSLSVNRQEKSQRSQVENAIIDTLAKLDQNASLAYKQALRDIDEHDRYSYFGTANELRQSVWLVLEILAPDAEVMRAKEFKLEAGRERPTMRQKVKFILNSRHSGTKLKESALKTVEVIEEKIASFGRSIYESSSAATHAASEKKHINILKQYVNALLMDLLALG